MEHAYFYAKEKTRSGKYIVFDSSGTTMDIAERKARTVAKRSGLELAGGLFTHSARPYDFNTNYLVLKVPSKTRPASLTARDKFIMGIIDYESGRMPAKQERSFLKKNKSTLINLQGHYGRRLLR